VNINKKIDKNIVIIGPIVLLLIRLLDEEINNIQLFIMKPQANPKVEEV
jgi:hypothetical protein